MRTKFSTSYKQISELQTRSVIGTKRVCSKNLNVLFSLNEVICTCGRKTCNVLYCTNWSLKLPFGSVNKLSQSLILTDASLFSLTGSRRTTCLWLLWTEICYGPWPSLKILICCVCALNNENIAVYHVFQRKWKCKYCFHCNQELKS